MTQEMEEFYVNIKFFRLEYIYLLGVFIKLIQDSFQLLKVNMFPVITQIKQT